MRSKNILIVGASGSGKVVIDIVRSEGKYNVAGFIDSKKGIGETVLGVPVLGDETVLSDMVEQHDISGLIVAIGDNFQRSIVSQRIAAFEPKLTFCSAVHARATIADDVVMGEGVVVMAGAVVNPGCHIGSFCLLNTGSILDHDSLMCDYSSLAPGTKVGGGCKIGEYSVLGIGSCMAHKLEVGKHTVIGAGANVVKSLGSNAVCYGSPARKVRSRVEGEEYL
jgi:sugar O-acyltransferase (sialic acid O-acetyltransferase NeuD family)